MQRHRLVAVVIGDGRIGEDLRVLLVLLSENGRSGADRRQRAAQCEGAQHAPAIASHLRLLLRIVSEQN